jgi:hypothetical protein
MNCTSCKKPLKEGATKCACGAAAPASYSYDLLPDEPVKKTESEGGPGQQYALPPGAVLPPAMALPGGGGEKPEKPPMRARGANSAAGGKTNFMKLGIGAGVALILIVLSMKMCGGSSNKITGPAARLNEQTFTVYSSSALPKNFEILGKGEYTFTVEAKNGDISIGVQMRGPKERIGPEQLKNWNLTPVKKGESKTLTGELGTGTYSLIIATSSKTGVTGTVSGSVK